MEIRAFAERVLLSDSLSEKLIPIETPITDHEPGEPFDVDEPTRPANLQFAPKRTAPAMPKFAGLVDPARRALAHHIMANHELQALEVMAWTLLRFPKINSSNNRADRRRWFPGIRLRRLLALRSARVVRRD